MPVIPSAGDSVRSALHRYAIHELLNKGALANAFRATDEEGRKVFLKAYTSPTTFKPWYDAYLRYAIELNRRLGADTVLAQQSVRATDVFSATFTHDGVPTRNPCIFQAYPFISGNRNLGDLISDGYRGRALTGDERLMVAAIFTAALARLHAARVIHCDLKPANVQMVRIGDGDALLFRPLLVDMDYSVLADKPAPWHGDTTAGYVGTPGFFSPEHLRGDVPTTASDVFTSGIILWQLLAGRHPFFSARAAGGPRAPRLGRHTLNRPRKGPLQSLAGGGEPMTTGLFHNSPPGPSGYPHL
jgi:serine/threonine protein kinase